MIIKQVPPQDTLTKEEIEDQRRRVEFDEYFESCIDDYEEKEDES